MKESLAAGLLRQSGWHEKLKTAKENDDYQLRLIDPMCGSGSLVLEAAMMAADIAPGLMRIRCHVPNHASPPVTRWKSETDTEMLWKQVGDIFFLFSIYAIVAFYLTLSFFCVCVFFLMKVSPRRNQTSQKWSRVDSKRPEQTYPLCQ